MESPPPPAHPHFLVVEDDPTVAEALAFGLAGAYAVHTVATGHAACSVLKTRPIAAIILDVFLGDENGLDYVSEFRDLCRAPILILTGHSSEELAIRAVREQANGYLKKPVSLRDLHADLKRLVPPAEPSPDPIARARDQLLDSLDQPHTTASLAREVGVSERHLRRRFKEAYGQTLRGELTELRLRRAAQLLRRTCLGIKQVAYTVGFPTLRAFERAFKCAFGITPSEYRTLDPEERSEVFLADREP